MRDVPESVTTRGADGRRGVWRGTAAGGGLPGGVTTTPEEVELTGAYPSGSWYRGAASQVTPGTGSGGGVVSPGSRERKA